MLCSLRGSDRAWLGLSLGLHISCRCKALDASADGYVRSEACVASLLHRIEPVAEDEDQTAWAVILRGSAVNQGGRSSTLTAPNGPSQQEVIVKALRDAALPPAAMSALGMHGTGDGL